ncbi:MAG: UDP-N-acetylmuramoyl-tripeptide--D-alanyl-D-alanine ligase [Bacteroidetes bacterium]|nr:UDP-N-acetylmuramoyl-tripeptide--D-alanyl-D-alanine ligase [Bacteroidota bacterium]MCY4205798.1 UDP-N-acetylmuramoyl-tripeptide--D-alanyl-D-alanine ligase [Bacteroidota bacterium]
MSFSTDTRTIKEGDTYIAIRGERYDGHDFVQEALNKGAERAIVERTIDGVCITRLKVVPDSIEYIAGVAQSKVNRARAQVIAITGSVGKTTTRNAVTQVMQAAGNVVSSVGNLNTLLGLSLTLANSEIRKNSRLVLEMGASKKGDLSEICQYFKPDISIVTNVRGVHLEMLGTIEGVREEKCEIVRALDPTGIACLNADDKLTRGMMSDCKGSYLLYGMASDADVTPRQITAETGLLGRHVTYILLAAFAAGTAVGIAPHTINEALSRLKPEKGRLNRLPARRGAVLIDDSYNASPDAVEAALGVLVEQTARRRIAFLGDMLELGDSEQEAHKKVLQKAVKVADVIYGCGPRMQSAAMELSSILQENVQCFSDSNELVSELLYGGIYRPELGDVILVKGSQGSRMERVSRVLLAEDISPESVLPRQNEAWLSI